MTKDKTMYLVTRMPYGTNDFIEQHTIGIFDSLDKAEDCIPNEDDGYNYLIRDLIVNAIY